MATVDLGNGITYTPRPTLAVHGRGPGPQPYYTINGVKYTPYNTNTYTYGDGTTVPLNVPSGQTVFMSSSGQYFTAVPGQAPSSAPVNIPANSNEVPMSNAGVDVSGNSTYWNIMNAQQAGTLGISKDGSSLINTQNGQTLVDGLSAYPNQQGVYQFTFYNPNSEGNISAVIAANPQTGKVATINPATQMAYTPGSPGGVLSGLLSAVAPIAGIAAALIPGVGLGATIADSLGLDSVLTGLGLDAATAASIAPQVGSGLLSVAKGLASGQSLDTAVTNAGIGAFVATGSPDISNALQDVTQNPDVAKALTSAVDAAATTALKGGNTDQILTNALIGSGVSAVSTNLPQTSNAPSTSTGLSSLQNNTVASADTGTTSDVTAPTTGALPTLQSDSTATPIDSSIADTGLASLPSSVSSAADAFGAPAPAVDAGTSAIQAGLAASPDVSTMGSLANIPGNIGGDLPTGGGLDTSAAATGVSSTPDTSTMGSLANIPGNIGGDLPVGGGLDTISAAGSSPSPIDSTMGSLANIPGNIGGDLPIGGGLDTSAAATGVFSQPDVIDPNIIGTTSNYETGLQTNAVIDPATGEVTNVPTGQSLTGTPAPSSGSSVLQNILQSISPTSTTPTTTPTTTLTSGLPSSTTTNNFTDILSNLAQSGLSGDKTGRTLLQPSMIQTSSPQSIAQILGALKQLNIPIGNQPALSAYHPKLINAVLQRMAHGGRPHHIEHPEAEPGEPIFRTGGHSNYVQGKGDGQSDDIPAMLADGEYVIDAELVSQLGDGSNKAGAEKLDRFREAIRRHKRSAPDNKIPPKAKKLTSYLKEAKRG